MSCDETMIQMEEPTDVSVCVPGSESDHGFASIRPLEKWVGPKFQSNRSIFLSFWSEVDQ